MNIEEIFDSLFDYYNVSTFSQLSQKMNIGQPAISKWKKNNSVAAIKKRCRELGIYNDIFGDSTTFIQTAENSQQIKEQNNSAASYNNVHMTNEDIENLELLKALNAMALALNKKDRLKAELTKLISTLPDL